jgi:hypothetical protein
MSFRASGRRIAVDTGSWHLPLTSNEIRERLHQSGFVERNVDVTELALSRVGQSVYQRGASFAEAPHVVDCSSFVKWLYGERGIWIPRRSLHQFSVGTPITESEILPGDLVFLSSPICPPIGTPDACVTHVGIVVDHERVVHATETHGGIAFAELARWQHRKYWRGARRILPADRPILTLDVPSHLEIETSDDVCWHLLETITW